MSELRSARIAKQWPVLVRCLQPAGGLLNELVTSRIISHSQRARVERLPTWDRMNEEILRLVRGDEGLCERFVNALMEVGQLHVVCALNNDADSENAPISDDQLRLLDQHWARLVDSIAPDCGLLNDLVSRRILRRRDAVWDMNEELLKLLRRGSRKGLEDFIACLVKSDQAELACLLLDDCPDVDRVAQCEALPVVVSDGKKISDRFDRQFSLMIRSMNPANGLLHELISLAVIDHAEKERAESFQSWDEANEYLLDVLMGRCVTYTQFLTALRRCGQSHVANALNELSLNTEDVPLSDGQLLIIDLNTSYIVDHLDLSSGLLNQLLADDVILLRDSSFLKSRATLWDMNEDFIALLRRRSRLSLQQFVSALKGANQWQIGWVLQTQGIVCRVHIELLNSSNVIEMEKIAVAKLNEVLERLQHSQLTDETDRNVSDLLDKLCLFQLHILSASVGGSIVIHWLCRNRSALERLRHLDTTKQLEDILRNLLKMILSSVDISLRVKPWVVEYERCAAGFETFNSSILTIHVDSVDRESQTPLINVPFQPALSGQRYMNKLPTEMMSTILQKAALIQGFALCETQSNAIPTVYTSLASVCSIWRSVIRNGSFKRFIAKTLFEKWGPYYKTPQHLHTMEAAGGWVRGVALDNEYLYLAMESCSTISIFSLKDFSEHSFIKVDKMQDPWDLAACSEEGCLYVSDWQKNCIWKASRDLSYEWLSLPSAESPRGISVSRSRSVVLVGKKLYNPYFLAMYDHRAQLILRCDLLDIEEPNRASELSNGNFVLCQGRLYETKHRVCEIDRGGNILRAYGGDRTGGRFKRKISGPDGIVSDSKDRVMFADWGNDRVRQLSADMTVSRVLIGKECGLKGRPRRLAICERSKLLVVGQDSGHVSIYRLFN